MIPLVVALIQSSDPYAHLAATIPSAEWKAAESYIDGKGPVPSFLPPDSTMLSAQRSLAQRWSAVLDGLRQVSDLPYTSGKVDPIDVLTLTKFIGSAARSHFATGERHGAVTFLLDGLTMVRRIRSDEGEVLVLRFFAQNLSQLPLAECDRVRKAADGYLASASNPETGLRLLRAHMRIEAYRWQWLKLPASLKEAMPMAETLDGTGGRPFRFEQTAGGYTLKTEAGGDGLSRTLSGPISKDSEGS